MRPQQEEQMFGMTRYGYLGIGHSCANMAYQLAYVLGHQNIVFIGQDLAFGKDGASNLVKEKKVPLLAQIPIVQSICEGGDNGEPAATKVDSVMGQAFLSLAQAVVTVVNRRNKELAPTKIVDVNNE